MAKPKDAAGDYEAALEQSDSPAFVLRLFVAGTTTQSTRAIVHLKEFCEANLKDRYQLEVIDVYQQPALAKAEQIVAVPTLIRKLPLPLRRLIGDLSNEERVLVGLELQESRARKARQTADHGLEAAVKPGPEQEKPRGPVYETKRTLRKRSPPR